MEAEKTDCPNQGPNYRAKHMLGLYEGGGYSPDGRE